MELRATNRIKKSEHIVGSGLLIGVVDNMKYKTITPALSFKNSSQLSRDSGGSTGYSYKSGSVSLNVKSPLVVNKKTNKLKTK